MLDLDENSTSKRSWESAFEEVSRYRQNGKHESLQITLNTKKESGQAKCYDAAWVVGGGGGGVEEF
jgi:hypothetical protein